MCFGSVQSDCLRDKITNNGSISLAFGTFSLLTINKKETTMVWMTLIILIGVALIDGKLWKIMRSQGEHNRKVETLLSEIRDKQL